MKFSVGEKRFSPRVVMTARVLANGGGRGEVLVAVSASWLTLFFISIIHLNPLTRIGQVSILATINAIGLFILAVYSGINYLFCSRKERRIKNSYFFASAVGVTSGILSGGVASALEGTPYPLNAMRGDMGNLAKWTDSTVGKGYPPLYIYLNKLVRFITGNPSLYSLKTLGVLTVSLALPTGYICWRRICNPRRKNRISR